MKSITLVPWTDACGKLMNVTEKEGCLTLNFGKFQVNLSLNESIAIKKLLNDDLIGKYISILRTDSPNDPILLIML